MLEPGKQVVATMVQPMLTGMRQVELQMQQQAPAWGAFWDAGNLPFQRQNGLERHSSLCTFRFCSFLCIVPVHVGGTPGDGEPAEQDMLPPISGGKTSVIYAYSLQFIKSSRSKPFVSSSTACHPVTCKQLVVCTIWMAIHGNHPFLILFEGEKLLAEGAVDSAHLDSDFGV